MKRTVSVILVCVLLLVLPAGCGVKGPAEAEPETKPETETAAEPETASSVSKAAVTLPCSAGAAAVVEGEAVIATRAYILSRAYFEKLASYDTDHFDAQEYAALLAETVEAFRVTGGLCDQLEVHAGALAEAEELNALSRESAGFETLSSAGGSSVFTLAAANTSNDTAAVKFARELTEAFDNAKNGEKLRTLAEKYNTDVAKAKVLLEQAQAILEGAAYEDQAAFENKCYEFAVETKAAASTVGFGVGCAAFIASGGAAAAGLIEGGGLVMNGVSALIDIGTAVTVHTTNGEGNEYTAAWEKTAEMVAPVSAVFAIGGGIGNIKDFRDPKKAADAVDNAAQALITGLGFARDYAQDGAVLGVSAEIIDGYRRITVRSADCSDPDAAKEVLIMTGVSEKDTDESAAVDSYIESMSWLADPYDPVDLGAVLGVLDDAFNERLADETGGLIDIEEKDGPAAEDPGALTGVSGIYSVTVLRFVQAGISGPYDDRIHVALNGTEITIEDETDDVEKMTGTYDEKSMTAEFEVDQGRVTVTFDGKGHLLYSWYNTNDGVLYIEIEAEKLTSDAV